MENIIYFLFFFILFINIKLYPGLQILEISPLFIKILEGSNEGIILTFDQSMISATKEDLTLVHSSGPKNFTLNCSTDNQGDNVEILYFDFSHDKFADEGFEAGNYFLYYGNLRYNEPILIYYNEMELIDPTNRYYLNDGSSTIQALFEFSKNAISKDQINRITYYDDKNPNQIFTLLGSNYEVTEKGTTLNLTFNRVYEVKTYTFNLYPTTQEDTENPLSFKIFFQDFFVKYEAVYANASASSALVFFQIEFRQGQFDQNQFSVSYSGDYNNVVISRKNFTGIGPNLYNYFFTIDNKPYPGQIIIKFRKNNNEQQRPIYLITYQTNKNKCYLSGTKETFDITFTKINEMKYTHSVFFNATPYPLGLTPSDQGTNVKYTRSLNTFSKGIYHLYSRIGKLSSSENNPVDNSSLLIKIFKDPGLEDDNPEIIYTRFNENQSVTFNMTDAGYVNEIFLISPARTITLYLDSNQCSAIKDNNAIYKCNFTNLDESYIANYSVNYTCECDNKSLQIKKKIIRIVRGIFFNDINPKYCFIDEVSNTKVILTYSSFIVGNDINISFCDNNNNCYQQIPDHSNFQTTSASISNLRNLNVGIYYIRTIINGQIIENKNIKFKVLMKLNFNFNHHYFIKNKTIKENYLIITKNFIDNNNDICTIQDDGKKTLNGSNCNNFIYEINNEAKLGKNSFKYLDKDINEYIPIDDSIYVEENINRLITFNNLKSCYYYLFSFSSSFRPGINFTERIFLYINNTNEEIEFVKNNNIYELSEPNKQRIFNLIGQNLELYISEQTRDRNVYLYKSLIKFTNINVPEFVIYPNNSIYFSNISCNLCGSDIKIISDSHNYDLVSNCRYLNNNSMTIEGAFYSFNEYKYQKFSIDNQNIITNINNNTPLLTFVSNNLNRSKFDVVASNKNNTFYQIEITNTEKDFYSKLKTDLVFYKLINGKRYETIILNNTRPLNEFKISENDYKLSFVMPKGNYDLDINHIKREKQKWETNEDNTFYHYFNYIYKNSIFRITPSVFASHALTEEEFNINIIFNNSDLLNSLINYAPNICTKYNNIDSITLNCTLDTTSLTKNETKRLEKKLYDYPIIVDFIYYNLSEKSTCVTLKNLINNLDFNIYVPDNSYLNQIYLRGINYNNRNTNEAKKIITYSLPIDDINLVESRLTISNNADLNRDLYLKDLGINFIPKYDFNERGKNIILLPQKNQIIKLTYNNYNSNDLNNITSFIIGNINSKDIKINTDNSINITFDLDSDLIDTSKTYNLFYKDKCNESISTDITIQIISFNFNRHYFILSNNNNQQNGQILQIKGLKSQQIFLYYYKEGQESSFIPILIYDNKTQCYNLTLTESGTYGFFYYYNDIIRNEIEDKVYVYNEIEELFDIITNFDECMFFDTGINLYFNMKFQDNTKNDYSPFFMRFKNVNEYMLNKETISNNNGLQFSLSYENIGGISQNKTLLIYLTEKNDKEYPLYLYKYKFTNITLNSNYTDVIYSDAEYLLFNMSCKINDLKYFNIYQKNSNIRRDIKCTILEPLIENNVYKCFLNQTSNEFNPFNKSDLVYDYYTMKYNNAYSVVEKEKEFYISKEIITSEFRIKKEELIYTFSETNIELNSTNNMFYLPTIESITFRNCSDSNCNYYQDITKENSFEGEFNETNNYIPLSLYINAKSNYNIFIQICRKTCYYCLHSNCKDITEYKNEYNITSNIPEIIFEFNRHYISLQDSYYNGNKSSDLKFNFTGSEKDKLDKVYYCLYTNNDTKNYSDCSNRIFLGNLNKDKEYTMSNLQEGIYILHFNATDNSRFFPVKDVIFVVNKDSDLLNLYDLDNNCLYYDQSEKVLFTSLSINDNYLFKDVASNTLKDLKIYFGNRTFNYISNNYGYELDDFLDDFYCESGKSYNYWIIENYKENVVFTKFPSEKNCTSLRFIDYLYKDNIILLNQICDLNNIYLKERNIPNSEVKLNCDFNGSISYCNIQNDFDRPNIDYNVVFKLANNYLNTYQLIHIYNSINTSKFDIDFKNPNLSIISSNFDMRNLSEVYLDNKLYMKNTEFEIQTSDQISFYYLLSINDSSVHNLTKLIRQNHSFDRISTIKHKDLNIQIKEMDCPEFQVAYLSKCWSCSELIKNNVISSEEKWFQNGKCVTKCNFTLGFGIFNEKSFYCQQCSEKTMMKDLNTGENYYLCYCLEGTVKSFEDDICYLPEMDEITKLTNIQRNTQCFKADGKTHNYCHNNENSNHTKDCIVESINGYFFPSCICEEEYSGKYCEFRKDKVNLTDNINYILSDNNIINEANITIISKIRGISYFLETESNTYIKHFNDNQMSLYINSSVQIFASIINSGRKTVPQIFDVVELAIYFLSYRIKNKKLRNLQEIDNDRKNLDYLLNNLHYINVQANINSTTNYKIQTDRMNLTTFVVYKIHDLEDESFKLEMANMKYFKVMEYINMNMTDENDLIFITLINSSLYATSQTNEGDFDVKAFFSTSRDVNNTNTLQNKTNFIFHISSLAINFNFDLAEYYKNKNIKIYDINDEAFNDPCYLSEDFDFDITQKYRKNNIFQKISFGNDVCKYINFEYKYMRLNFLCESFSNINKTEKNLTYGILHFNINKHIIDKANKVYNLPIKCTKRIKNIGNNLAFWFFLIICIIEIIYCIGIGVLTFGSLKNISFKKGLIQDEFYNIIPYKNENQHNEDSISNSEQIAKVNEKAPNKRNLHLNDYYDKSDNNSIIYSENEFVYRNIQSCIFYNFKELHPIATLCRVSLISPLILNSILFVFNTLILFGFNALLYPESLIEKRIFDKKRNNFDYPMRKEFHKIILSILCQIALCVIIKLIILVTLKKRNDFKAAIKKSCTIDKHKNLSNELVVKIEQFQDEMFYRRIISSFIMTIIIIFFFYYSVAFCGVYIQTQKNWLFSGIWSLFWNWIIFAPIYIVIISIIENKRQDINDPIVYYMKRLFFF